MKSFTPLTSFSNSRASLACLLTCIMLVAPLTPAGFASTNTSPTVQSKSKGASQTAPKAESPAKAAPVVQQQKDGLVTPSAVGPITATKDDNRTNAQPVGPTNTINYTVTITNNGSDPATGVVFSDMIDSNTTLVPSSIQVSPLANPDIYNVIGNVRIQPNAAQGLLSNDTDPDGDTLTVTGVNTVGTQGQVTFDPTGSFTFNPNPGYSGTTTFTYSISDGTGRNDSSTVTLNVGNGTATPGANVIWFVNSAAPNGGDGRLTSPYNCLVGVGCFDPSAADEAGDIIFLHAGTYPDTGALTLLNNQRLIGQGTSAGTTLATVASVTAQPYSDPLPVFNGNPATVNVTSQAAGIILTSGNNNELRGFTFGNNGSGAKIQSTAFGTLTVNEVILNGTGQALNLDSGTLAATFAGISSTTSAAQGILLDQITGSLTSTGGTSITNPATQCVLVTASTAAMSFGDTTCSDATDGISLQGNTGANARTFGTLSVTGTNTGNAFLHSGGGGNTTVTGAASFTSNLDPVSIQTSGNATINFSGGATVTKTTAGGSGLNWGGTNTGGTLSFSTLAVTTSNGTGITLAGGGTFNVMTAAGSSISATGAGQAAPAINANGVTFGATFASVSSTNSGSGGNGIFLTNVLGNLTMNGGSISGAAGDAFRVNGGTANITYNGTISTSAARPVNIDNKTGGTVAFGGVPSSGTATISSTSNGVLLNNNAGATINFTGGLSLTTAGNAAFTATGGGTVNATQNNASILNTVNTTTGTGVNIQTPTNIGGSGVTFRSVTVSNGSSNSAANGIILSGTTGAFTVSGDGSQTGGFFDRDGTGGLITRTTGHSVSLTNATNVTLRQMNITNTGTGGACPGACTANAVNSSGGGSIVLSAVTLQNLGGNGWRADNITGTNAINHNSRIDTWSASNTNGVTVANTSTAFTGSSFTVDRCVFTTSATGGDGFLFDIDAAGGNGTVTVTNSEFTGIDQDAMQLNHDGSGILNATVQSNNFHDADTTGGGGNNTLVLVTGPGGGQLNFNIQSNTLTNLGRLSVNSGVLQVQASGGAGGSSTGARLNGTIQNNTLTNPGIPTGSEWRGIMAATEASAGSHGGHTISIKNNSVQNFRLQGIYVSFTTLGTNNDNTGNNVNISNNQVFNQQIAAPASNDGGSAIEMETLGGADGASSDISVTALIQGNTAVGNSSSGIGDTMELGNQSGPITGATNTSTMNLTVLGNTLTQQNASGSAFEARNVLTPNNTMCLDLNSGNTSPNNAIGGTGGFRLTNETGSTFAIEGMGASTPSAFLGPRNQSNGVSPATITTGGTGAFTSSAGCTNSTAPVADPDIPVAAKAAHIAPGDTSMAGATLQAASMTTTAAANSNDITSRPFIAMPQAAAAGVAKSAATSLNANARTREIVSNNDTAAAQNASPTGNAQGAKDGTVQPLVADFPVNIGTLGAGKTVTITFSVTVNNPLGAGVTQISNQGTVSGNFTSVQTDDPQAAGANNPTVTPVIPRPTITINNASITEPSTGSANMPFTVVLSNAYTVPVTVNLQTADGTATAPSDYLSTNGTLEFAAGETFNTISVPVLADGVGGESDENFTVTLSAPTNATINGTGIATGTIKAVSTPGRVLISEVRTSGPNGSGDDFVELYNNQNVTQDISGWALFKSGAGCTSTPVLVGIIPANTTIPPRGHYLIVGPQYNAADFNNTAGNPVVVNNATVTAVADIESDRNLALFNTSNLLNLSTETREDAVGFDVNAGGGFNCDLLREGATLASALGSTTSQYSFARRLTSGTPKETNDNAADFQLVTTTPAVAVGNNTTPPLGAPGPENLADPIQRNADIKASLIDGTLPAAAPPNRVRTSFGANSTNSAFGTLSIQRRFKNTLGVSVSRLRFRIVDLTTINNRPAGAADLRVLSSNGQVKNNAGNTIITVTGLMLEGPPQPNGGGLNSTLTVIPPGGALAAGATIDVQFLLGVQLEGNFSFFVNVEALPAPQGVAGGAATKKGVSAKQSSSDAAEPKEQQ